MKKILFIIIVFLLPFSVLSQISFEGSPVISITPEASTGLKYIYVVQNTSETKMLYSATSQSVTIERFSSMGGGYAEPVNNVSKIGNVYSIGLEGDMGYIITDGNNQLCLWVCNYANYPNTVTELIPAENDCDRLMLNVVGNAPEIPYYTINGRRMIVDRDIIISYNTLEYDGDKQEYMQRVGEMALSSVDKTVSIPAPLCATSVIFHPGKFASAWNEGNSVESQWIEPNAVSASVSAIQAERSSDNEQSSGDTGDGLGGSAPAEITFSAAVSEAAIFRRWEFSSSPNFEDIQTSFSDLEIVYTFEEAGTTYVRFVCDNAAGTCPFESEVFTVTIGDSRLECPNAFSPGTSEGVNDEWKVSYRSIIEFHCEIFNRWGQKLATLTDPSQGWDGKVGGKTVGSGVYFYVINALGSDGKRYKLSGDINVISSRRQTNSGSSSIE